MSTAGLLLVDKPEGPTSHDIVAQVRRAAGVRRVGHAGTLDPFATGLLVLCVGWATRLAEYLLDLPKSYRAVARLGAVTETDDRTGAVIASDEGWRSLEAADVERALRQQLGEIEQRPPAYSAVKVEGQRAYALARAGEPPRLNARRVRIDRLQLRELSPPDATIEIECSSGTYVRAVARDLGEALGVGAHLVALRRTRIGDFGVNDAIAIDQDLPRGELLGRLLPPALAVRHLTRADLDAAAGDAMRRGQSVDWPGELAGPVAVFAAGELLAIAEPQDGRLQPRKVFGAAA